jgi:hypothetical protein
MMAGGVLVLGILLMILVAGKPRGTGVFSTPAKIILGIVLAPVVGYLVLVGVKAPENLPYLLGKCLAYVLVIGIFVFIGEKLRKKPALPPKV